MTWATDDLLRHGVQRFGTPLYVIDLEAIRGRYRQLEAVWQSHFPTMEIAYSFKTNSLPAVTRALRDLGAAAEVVSGTELAWALADGYEPTRIYFDGPFKSRDEVRYALRLGVNLQIDSLDELATVRSIAEGAVPRVAVRLATPLPRGGMSRFGLTPPEAVEVLRLARSGAIRLDGVHYHVGSNVDDPARYLEALTLHLPLVRALHATGIRPLRLDLGGGLPAASRAADTILPADDDFVRPLSALLSSHGIPVSDLHIVIEPGRSLVEEFGWLVTKVAVRKPRGSETIVVVDGGTNLVPSVRRWFHPIRFLRQGTSSHPFHVFGPQCFESDLLAPSLQGPSDLAVGDLLAVGHVGGYDISTAIPWIRPLPPVATMGSGTLAIGEYRRATVAPSFETSDAYSVA